MTGERTLKRIRNRLYRMEIIRHNGAFVNHPGKVVQSNHRIRQVCIEVFQRYFGRCPTNHWHKDGFMAEAWNERGDRLMVEQINSNCAEIYAAGADIICG